MTSEFDRDDVEEPLRSSGSSWSNAARADDDEASGHDLVEGPGVDRVTAALVREARRVVDIAEGQRRALPPARRLALVRSTALRELESAESPQPHESDDSTEPVDAVEWDEPVAGALALSEDIERTTRIKEGQRKRRLPAAVTAATAAAGYAAWEAAQSAIEVAGPAAGPAVTVTTAGLCTTCVIAMRRRMRERISQTWSTRWWTAAATASGWVTAASAFGPVSWEMTAVLLGGALLQSGRWQRAHAVPRPGDQVHQPLPELPEAPAPELPAPSEPPALPAPPPEPEVKEPDLGEVLEQRWAENISCRGGVLPGAKLGPRVDFPRAIRWTVTTPAGSVTFKEILPRQGRIAAGLKQRAARIVLEPGEDESEFELTVVTSDALAEGIPYIRPRYENGRIYVGDHADGTGAAYYIAYDEVGCRNGAASGEPGSGKSAFLESVALGLKSSGEWYLLFGDGDPEGGSSPLLNRVADWASAGPEQVLGQLEALEAVLETRGIIKSTLTEGPDGRPVPMTDPDTQEVLREMRPSPQFPAIKWIIDELHRLTSDAFLKKHNFAKRLERLVRIGRKYGIVVLTGSQSLLIPDFGSISQLRAYLTARNLFAFRNTNKTETATVAGLKISPATLPPGGGYAFSTSSLRLAMLRVAWARDMAKHAVDLPATTLDPDTALTMDRYRPSEARDPAAQFARQTTRLQQHRAISQLELALRGLDSVRSAAAAYHSQPDGSEQLVAYVVPTHSAFTPSDATGALAGHVPEELMPTTVMVLTQMPVTASGNVDRSALPKPRLDKNPAGTATQPAAAASTGTVPTLPSAPATAAEPAPVPAAASAPDPGLLADAAQVVISAQRGSSILLSRTLQISHAEARTVLTQLEPYGVVAPAKGDSPLPRLVLAKPEQLDDVLQAIANGEPIIAAPQPAPADYTATGTEVSAVPATGPAVTPSGTVAPLPAPSGAEQEDLAAAAPVRVVDDGDLDLDVLNNSQSLVYNALLSGLQQTGDIAAATKLTLSTTSKALGALADDYGLAHKISHGNYRPVRRHLAPTG